MEKLIVAHTSKVSNLEWWPKLAYWPSVTSVNTVTPINILFDEIKMDNSHYFVNDFN